MKTVVARLKALQRHYKIQIFRGLSLLSEYIEGFVSYLRWTPQLIRISRHISRVRRTPRAEVRFNLSDLPTIYINLGHRTDRRLRVEEVLRSVGIRDFERFPAISDSLGILGCTKSHAAVLEKAIDEKYPIVMICEDDMEFLGERDEILKTIVEFINNSALDVLCLAYRLRSPRFSVSRRLAIANNIQTASCYVVKQEAMPTVLESFQQSERMLQRGVDPRIAANDMHWKKIQTKGLVFALPKKRLARQRPSFSNVVGKFKDYRA